MRKFFKALVVLVSMSVTTPSIGQQVVLPQSPWIPWGPVQNFVPLSPCVQGKITVRFYSVNFTGAGNPFIKNYFPDYSYFNSFSAAWNYLMTNYNNHPVHPTNNHTCYGMDVICDLSPKAS